MNCNCFLLLVVCTSFLPTRGPRGRQAEAKQLDSSSQRTHPPTHSLTHPDPAQGSPADILRVRGEGHRPLGGAELPAVGGRLGLPFAVQALALAGIEVFQDAAGMQKALGARPASTPYMHVAKTD